MNPLSATDWNRRYENQDTPWDLQSPTPELARLLREGRIPQRGRALVPGGGRGYDAILLAQAGLEVDLVDFAPAALESALSLAAQAKVTLNVFRQDFFALPKLSFHRNSYDLIWEYTFFCAIPPEKREAYAQAIPLLLRKNGYFFGLFFPLASTEAGPPFLVEKEEIVNLFSSHSIQFETPLESVKPRAGRELLGFFQR